VLLAVAAGCAGEPPREENVVSSSGPRNHLAGETSPYLLQHADNPVDWYPWGEEAFERARAENKPVLVSIGYSSCHWCHVMEHESFEDPAIAQLMNEHFVCIKVDREERPDVDELYMSAVQVLGLGGGWPLNVFVTPDGRPFWGGTYFPPDSRYGRPGWPDVLRQLAAAWETQRDAVDRQAQQLVGALAQGSAFELQEELPEEHLLAEARDRLVGAFDEENGGFGGAPKFPPCLSLRFLLRRHARTGDAEALHVVDVTLRRMAAGGIHDHLAGGFHRYSVDERWLVPHFEKMLYDNAQLARVYTEAWQVTGEELFARVARGTLDYVLREMTEPEGGFRSATDADSDGREGAYFVWTKPQLEELLGEDAGLFARAYGVTDQGNFVDPHHPPAPGEPRQSVLHLPVPVEELARREDLEREELEERLAKDRAVLLRHRTERVPPLLDDKVLASWNGLMIGTLAYAGRVLDEPRYTDAAERAARFVLDRMRTPDGRLLRTSRAGEAKIPAFLEDYAFLASALLDLYETTFDLAWFREARTMAAEMNRLFGDDARGGWRHTGTDAEGLAAEIVSPTDGSIPNANAVAASVMVRLATLTGDDSAWKRADKAVRLFREPMERYPQATVGLLLALDGLLHEDGEVAFVGDPETPAMRELMRPARSAFLPGTAFALLDPARAGEAEREIPLLAGKTLVDGAGAAYVCRDFACRAPVTTADDLERTLAELR